MYHVKEKDRGSEILLIIPAHNEEDNLLEVVRDIEGQERKLSYIIVSDGSTDGTVDLCRREGFPCIVLPVNVGLSACFQTGMKYAYREGYQYAVQFDGDGQHRASDIGKMKDAMDEGGYDLVLGSRFLNQKKGKSAREWGSRLITLAIRLTTGKTVSDPTCGLRMYSRRAITDFANRMNYGPEPDTISYLLKSGYRVTEAEVNIREREHGESYLRPLNALWYMLRMLTSILLVQGFRGLPS